MKTRTIIILSSLAGFSVIGVAGYYFYSKQVKLLSDFKYKLIYFNLGKIDAEETTCILTVRIYSDSTLSAEIRDLILDVYVDNKKLGRIQKYYSKPEHGKPISNDKLIIPAKGYSDVKLEITFSPKLVFGAAYDIITKYLFAKDFTIDLKGYINGKSGIISASVPFEYHTTLKEIMTP